MHLGDADAPHALYGLCIADAHPSGHPRRWKAGDDQRDRRRLQDLEESSEQGGASAQPRTVYRGRARAAFLGPLDKSTRRDLLVTRPLLEEVLGPRERSSGRAMYGPVPLLP